MKKDRQEFWKEKGYTEKQIQCHLEFERRKSKESRERRKKNNEKKYKEYERLIKSIGKKKERLMDLYLRGDINRDKFKEQESQLNKEEEDTIREMDKIKESRQMLDKIRSKSLNFEKLYGKLGKNLESVDYKTKTNILRLLVDRIETNGKGMAKISCILPKEVVLGTDKRVNYFSKRLAFSFKVKFKKPSYKHLKQCVVSGKFV